MALLLPMDITVQQQEHRCLSGKFFPEQEHHSLSGKFFPESEFSGKRAGYDQFLYNQWRLDRLNERVVGSKKDVWILFNILQFIEQGFFTVVKA